MNKVINILSILFVAVLSTLVIAQPATGIAEEKVSVKFLKEDLNTLKTKLQSSQPGLYLYTSKDSMDRMFSKISSSLDQPMTSLEFFRKIASLNKFLRNLHTLVLPSEAYKQAVKTDLSRLPVDIHWQNDHMYVLRNNSGNDEIVPGSVITTINGESAETIFRTLLGCRIRDGFNETYPIAHASRNFGSSYAELIGTPGTFIIEFITPDGTEKKIELQGKTGTEINKSRLEKYSGRYSQYSEDWDAWIAEKEPALRLEMKGNVAVMTLRTFSTYIIEGKGQKYEEFFKGAFSQLDSGKTTDLIIDMRNNHGGHDLVGMSLMSHLHDSVFYYYKRRSSQVRPKGKFARKGNIYELIGRRGWIGKVTPAHEMFTGNVYVLMNGYSVSAAGELIGHLKNIDRAIFIGEEAGGNPVIFTGGQRLLIDLPHTHITGSIPLILTEMNVYMKNTGHGVMPDCAIQSTIKEILEEKDVEMEFTLQLIKDRLNNNK